MNFKDYYKFPLRKDKGYSKVFTSDFKMAFDFPYKLIYPDSIQILEEDKDTIIEIINGSAKEIKNNYFFKYSKGEVTLNDKLFIVVRGWGMLTSSGGYNLKSSLASKIQDDFGQYIADKLNKARV